MPCPEGLAWLLLGCSRYIPIAKAMPKGSCGTKFSVMCNYTEVYEIK